jgi:hypothetical protein
MFAARDYDVAGDTINLEDDSRDWLEERIQV